MMNDYYSNPSLCDSQAIAYVLGLALIAKYSLNLCTVTVIAVGSSKIKDIRCQDQSLRDTYGKVRLTETRT